MNALALSFNNTKFDVIDRNNQPWLKSPQIAAALGYADQSSINRIFARNSDEFTDSMTASVKLTDPNGDLQETRVFSLRGCHLLAMFSRTTIAKEFRKWVLDILDKETQSQCRLKELPNPVLTTEQKRHIQESVNRIQVKQGIHYATTYHNIKTAFKVSTYAELKQSQYADVCRFLGVMPIEPEIMAIDVENSVNGVHSLPSPETSESFEGRVLMTIRNGKVINTETLPEGARLFTPDDAPSINAWVYEYVPARHLHTVMKAVSDRVIAISGCISQELQVKA